MNKLLELSVRTRLFAFVVAAVLAVWGAYAYRTRLMRRRSRSFAPWMQTIEAPIFALVVGGALIW